MTHRQTVKRLATAIAAGGVLAIAPVAIPAATAAPADCPGYQVSQTATILLSVSPANPGVGDPFTTTVSVLTGGVPVPGGKVIFNYGTQPAQTKPVRAGTASATFIAENGAFALSARYVGDCLEDGTAIDPTTETQPIVAGVAAFGGGGNGGSHNVGAARPGATIGGVGGVGGVSGGSGSTGSGSTAGTLASTGVDSQTELYGLLGLGLVTVGGLTLMVHRRRVQG